MLFMSTLIEILTPFECDFFLGWQFYVHLRRRELAIDNHLFWNVTVGRCWLHAVAIDYFGPAAADCVRSAVSFPKHCSQLCREKDSQINN